MTEKKYTVTTVTTYIFPAESDDDAIKMVEEHFGDVEQWVEGEALEQLTIMDSDDDVMPRVVKDYR